MKHSRQSRSTSPPKRRGGKARQCLNVPPMARNATHAMRASASGQRPGHDEVGTRRDPRQSGRQRAAGSNPVSPTKEPTLTRRNRGGVPVLTLSHLATARRVEPRHVLGPKRPSDAKTPSWMAIRSSAAAAHREAPLATVAASNSPLCNDATAAHPTHDNGKGLVLRRYSPRVRHMSPASVGAGGAPTLWMPTSASPDSVDFA